MYLWLDDVRKPPPIDGVEWFWAKTVKEAKEWLDKHGHECIAMSLDHDLGAFPADDYPDGEEIYLRGDNSDGCGCEVAKYIIDNNYWPSLEIVIHSWNPSAACGAIKMEDMLKAANECCLITYIPFDPRVYGI